VLGGEKVVARETGGWVGGSLLQQFRHAVGIEKKKGSSKLAKKKGAGRISKPFEKAILHNMLFLTEESDNSKSDLSSDFPNCQASWPQRPRPVAMATESCREKKKKVLGKGLTREDCIPRLIKHAHAKGVGAVRLRIEKEREPSERERGTLTGRAGVLPSSSLLHSGGTPGRETRLRKGEVNNDDR